VAETQAASAVTVEQWDDQFFVEYIRANRFSKFMGTDQTAIIHVKEDLIKEPGDGITFPFLSRLRGAGVQGDAVLEGNEEALGQFGHKVEVDVFRHGVVVTDKQNRLTPIDLRAAAKPALKKWSMEQLRNKIIDGFAAIGTSDGNFQKYADASEADKDTYLANNSDRVLFGAALSNNAANDHSACLSNIDDTADKMSPDIITIAKELAENADPHMTPYTLESEDEEMWVMFHNSRAWRNLMRNSTVTQAMREASERGKNNPLYKPGDFWWDGVLNRKVPEIGYVTSVGAGNITVGASYLCGQQALGVAWAQRWTTVDYETDAKYRKGCAIQGNYGVEKLFWKGGIQHGIVTVWTSAVATA
jgi:hypothetical protein